MGQIRAGSSFPLSDLREWAKKPLTACEEFEVTTREAVKQWRFEPALLDDQPVSVHFRSGPS